MAQYSYAIIEGYEGSVSCGYTCIHGVGDSVDSYVIIHSVLDHP